MSQTPDVAPAYVSVVNEFPEDLYDAMRNFVRSHPHWDQYRLMQVAVAGFLFQQGSRERAVARHYLDGLFDRGAGGQAPAERPDARGEAEATPAPITPLRQRPEAPARAAAPRRPVVPPMPHHEAAPPAFRHAA
ncbi:DUF2811 domain-containing protein [Synechococcus sp. CBW1004]|uniref:DUF2811 domain-containing protein n=1 Tax=Synechococcus sp. CBW1004 TaxID=1353136 RepID=UPI0018CFA11C|nr:DUF2811 domain-containing protein [Synechococcus sp. CBW1004]